jgi:hypothetical protein
MDPIVLDQMYEHPDRFGALSKDEYVRMLIDDIRFYRGQLAAVRAVIGTDSASEDERLAALRGFLRLTEEGAR